jgi:hypothetical protein
MARTYGYYCRAVHALEVERNQLAQTLQISGTPEHVEEFLHTLGAGEERPQPARHAGEQIKGEADSGTTILHQAK